METLKSNMINGAFSLILLLAFSIFSPTANAGALNAYSGPWQPITAEGLNTCQNETYTFSGKILLEVKTVADNSGGLHVSTLLRTRGIGIGNTTGARYIANEGGHVAENYLSSSSLDFTAVFNGIVVAVDKGVQDLRYRQQLHITVDANGNVTATVDKFEVFC